mmetsp:Transcript_10449/g.20588  ORF Transcript_10449/g.20588 Transcript_10449/m.20588 type:complete len:414 (+) Transcript_10449:120-1361(+)
MCLTALLDDTNGNGATLVTESKATELHGLLVRLQADGLVEADLANDGSTIAGKSRVALSNFTSLVKLSSNLVYSALLFGGVSVEDSVVTGREQRAVLKQVANKELSNDLCASLNRGESGGNNVALGDLVFVQRSKTSKNVLTRLRALNLLLVDGNGLDLALDLVWANTEFLANIHDTRLDLGHKNNTTINVAIHNGSTKGLFGVTVTHVDLVEHLKKGLAVIEFRGPVADILGNRVLDVDTRECRDRNKNDVLLDLESRGLEEGTETLDDIIITVLAPLDSLLIHLVNTNNQLLDTKSLGKHGVLTGLTSLDKASFELSLTCRNHKNTHICLTGTADHSRHVVLVARCVKNGQAAVLRLKVGASDLDSLTLGTLFIRLIHNVRQKPTVTVALLRLLLELFNRTLINLASKVQN